MTDQFREQIISADK